MDIPTTMAKADMTDRFISFVTLVRDVTRGHTLIK